MNTLFTNFFACLQLDVNSFLLFRIAICMLSSTFPKGILRHIRIGSCVLINLSSNLEVNFLVFQAPIHIY